MSEQIRPGQKQLWRCRDGHEWEASHAKIRQGSWCPACADGLSERMCRTALEQLFGHPFPKAHPDWLRPRSGTRPRQLDGYAEAIGVAFEYHGGQHYRVDGYLVRDRAQLRRRRARDAWKRRRCAQHGVLLIEIPEFPTPHGRERHVLDAVLDACSRAGRRPPAGLEGVQIDFNPAYLTGPLQELRELAARRGGRCLATAYPGATRKVEWECSKGHRWRTTSSNVRSGHWCHECGGQTPPTIAQLQAVAAARGGTCLSTVYTNAKTKLEWRCKHGHRWLASPDNIKRGKWCPECKRERLGASQRLSIEAMQTLARMRGGECVSTLYTNTSTHLLWRCGQGHTWRAVPSSVKHGTWCPECHRESRRGAARAARR